MSDDELIRAYAQGHISRRVFIRRLVTAGVSFGAAMSYAQLLAPGAAVADAGLNPQGGQGGHGGAGGAGGDAGGQGGEGTPGIAGAPGPSGASSPAGGGAGNTGGTSGSGGTGGKHHKKKHHNSGGGGTTGAPAKPAKASPEHAESQDGPKRHHRPKGS